MANLEQIESLASSVTKTLSCLISSKIHKKRKESTGESKTTSFLTNKLLEVK